MNHSSKVSTNDRMTHGYLRSFLVTFGVGLCFNHMGDLLRIALDCFESVPNLFTSNRPFSAEAQQNLTLVFKQVPFAKAVSRCWYLEVICFFGDDNQICSIKSCILSPSYRPSRLGCKHSSTKPSSATFRQTWRFLLGQVFQEKQGGKSQTSTSVMPFIPCRW